MGFFSKILAKLGLGKKDEPAAMATAAAPAKPAATAVKPAAPVAVGAGAKPAVAAVKELVKPVVAPVKAAPAPMSEVDVVAKLEQLSVGKGLNWKVSIVDLLKLLDLDSSFESRKELAVELGCPADLMGDSAKMNVWLHKTVLKKIAENGGNIPQALLD